ncbi:MAG: hypothetical protein JWQ28_406 [Pedobacter sp.]|nr:hypothetical protein [Pedobacter sp.]
MKHLKFSKSYLILLSLIVKELKSLFGITALLILVLCCSTFAQQNYKTIPLPDSLRGVNLEYSGLSWNEGRLFLLPQYGDHKETKLEGTFNLYSILADSIGRVIDGKDSSLTLYKTLKVKNLEQLPDSIKAHYEGFEAITMNKRDVYLAVESETEWDFFYILKGTLNAQQTEISIDPVNFITLRKYPFVENAGFESLTYLPKKHKLIAVYEYNAMDCGGIGFLIDPAFKKRVKKVNIPFSTFRITDTQSKSGKDLYALNFYYNGDYKTYLDNNLIRHAESKIKTNIPELKANIDANPKYLQEKTTNYARIMKMDKIKGATWNQVAAFPAAKNNWEGMALYRQGSLVISDANRSGRQVTTLAFIGF